MTLDFVIPLVEGLEPAHPFKSGYHYVTLQTQKVQEIRVNLCDFDLSLEIKGKKLFWLFIWFALLFVPCELNRAHKEILTLIKEANQYIVTALTSLLL